MYPQRAIDARSVVQVARLFCESATRETGRSSRWFFVAKRDYHRNNAKSILAGCRRQCACNYGNIYSLSLSAKKDESRGPVHANGRLNSACRFVFVCCVSSSDDASSAMYRSFLHIL